MSCPSCCSESSTWLTRTNTWSYSRLWRYKLFVQIGLLLNSYCFSMDSFRWCLVNNQANCIYEGTQRLPRLVGLAKATDMILVRMVFSCSYQQFHYQVFESLICLAEKFVQLYVSIFYSFRSQYHQTRGKNWVSLML